MGHILAILLVMLIIIDSAIIEHIGDLLVWLIFAYLFYMAIANVIGR